MPRFDKEYSEYLKGNCENYNQPLISALEEMEKGGEDMPKYGDDQCEECGGVRVAKSTLCAACLVKLFNKAVWRVVAQEKEIKRLVKKAERLRKMLKEVIAYGFKKNQENAELKQRVKGLCGKIREVMEDGRNRKAEDTKE